MAGRISEGRRRARPVHDGWGPIDGLALHAAGTMSYPPGATFGPRLLTDHELVWIVRGDCIAYRNGRSFDAPEGTLLLQQAGVRDAYDWDTRRETLHGFIHFDYRRLGRGWPRADRWPLQRLPVGESVTLTLFRFILGLRGAAPEQRAALLLPALELLLRTFVSGQDSAPSELREQLPAPVTRVVQLVRSRLESNPSERFRLAELAQHARVSAQHLCRVFRGALGIGPMECARLLRVEQAATFLERTDDPIRLVADRCGFASPYHFSRVFREVYGQPPREYRRKFLMGIQRGVVRPRRPAIFGDAALRWVMRG